MKTNDFIDYGTWWPEYYKRTCLSDDSYGKGIPKNFKKNFSISKHSAINFSSETPHSVKCKMNIAGLNEDTFKLRNTTTNVNFELPSKVTYDSVLPINIKKMEDIK